MEILFKKVRMLNFKGIHERTVEFSDRVTIIQGRNKIGKTTIADACWWVLFGKDSNGNTKFGLKTNGDDMKPIPHLDHEVELEMSVDGTRVVLLRQLKEIWASRRGECETLKSNSTISYINGNKVNEKDYIQYIDSLCNEGLFKVLSKSDVFFQLKPDAQRELLVRMVGEKDMDEFAEEHPEFKDLVKELAITDLNTYMSGISYKKKEIEKVIADNEARLKEQSTELDGMRDEGNGLGEVSGKIAVIDSQVTKLTSEMQECSLAKNAKMDGISSELANLRMKENGIREKVADEIARMRNGKNAEIAKAIVLRDSTASDVEKYIAMKKQTIQEDIDAINARIKEIRRGAEWEERQGKIEHDHKIEGLETTIRGLKAKADGIRAEISSYELQEGFLESQMNDFRKEWVKNEGIRDEIQEYCPTCHQRLPEEKIEEIRKEADERYERQYEALVRRAGKMKEEKAALDEKLAQSKKELESVETETQMLLVNLESVKERKLRSASDFLDEDPDYLTLMKQYQAKAALLNANTVALESDDILKELRRKAEDANKAYHTKVAERMPNAEELLVKDEEYMSVKRYIAELTANMEALAADNTNDEFRKETEKKISDLMYERDGLVKRLGLKDVIKAKESRIEELKDGIDTLQVQKAELEGKKQMAQDYMETMIRDLESRVNALFTGIRFKMFDEYMNGNIEPCCKCFIGVTEYKDGSHAERINAGLEMIDTMSRYNGIYVPCFVDDAEGINQVYETKAQQVRLVVTMEDQMHVIHL